MQAWEQEMKTGVWANTLLMSSRVTELPSPPNIIPEYQFPLVCFSVKRIVVEGKRKRAKKYSQQCLVFNVRELCLFTTL